MSRLIAAGLIDGRRKSSARAWLSGAALTLVLGTISSVRADGPAAMPDAQTLSRCRPVPRDKRVLKVNFKPDTAVADVIVWYGNISCTGVVFRPDQVAGKKVTIVSPGAMTLAEVEKMVFAAVDSVGLRSERVGKVIRISPAVKR